VGGREFWQDRWEEDWASLREGKEGERKARRSERGRTKRGWGGIAERKKEERQGGDEKREGRQHTNKKGNRRLKVGCWNLSVPELKGRRVVGGGKTCGVNMLSLIRERETQRETRKKRAVTVPREESKKIEQAGGEKKKMYPLSTWGRSLRSWSTKSREVTN